MGAAAALVYLLGVPLPLGFEPMPIFNQLEKALGSKPHCPWSNTRKSRICPAVFFTLGSGATQGKDHHFHSMWIMTLSISSYCRA